MQHRRMDMFSSRLHEMPNQFTLMSIPETGDIIYQYTEPNGMVHPYILPDRTLLIKADWQKDFVTAEAMQPETSRLIRCMLYSFNYFFY